MRAFILKKKKSCIHNIVIRDPKGGTSVIPTLSFLVVTIRSMRVRHVKVILVAAFMTFSLLNNSKIERSLLLFPLQSSLIEKSQFK